MPQAPDNVGFLHASVVTTARSLHQHHGTVQLLMMPLTTAPGSGKNSKWSDDDEDDSGECEPVPLPIQTFLWRQTNPFLGAKIGKLHESSCVTFERVVVQNILHGLSPSLSDAIASVSRWRFVRAAFPHIVQCCGALLAVRANEDESLPMSGSLVKIMYILHWLILDAAHECNETNEGEAIEVSLKKLTYSIPCIQMFVYLITPLCHVIKEEEIESHIRLESGLRLWQALWQFRQPDVLCFAAPVKQRKNHFPQLSKSKKPAPPIAVEQGIYLGDEQFTSARRPSNVHAISEPLPKPSTSSQEEAVAQKPSIVSESDKPGASKIVRSVSDYKTSDLASNGQNKTLIRKSRTDMFQYDSEYMNGLNNIDEAMQFTEDGSFSESFHFNDKAPLVQLQEICSGASLDTSDITNNDLCATCQKKPCGCSSTLKYPSKSSTATTKYKTEDTDSVGSQQTVINKSIKTTTVPPVLTFNDTKDSISTETDKSEASMTHDLNEASYLDVGTLKCLLIKNWSEDGVYWATKYFLNRLTEIRQYRLVSESTFRCRSNSVPNVVPRGSKHDLHCPEYLTWTDLQERSEMFQRSIGSDKNMTDNDESKTKVAFNVESKGSEKNTIKLKVVADKRRVSVNTLPAVKHSSKLNGKHRRNKSEPSISMPSNISVNAINEEEVLDNGGGQHYSEALGSSLFILPNGHLKLHVLMKALVGVVERCSAIRILEIILNICDIMLTMPNLGTLTIFEDVTKIVLKVYSHLGCPNGCNEGMRTPQADFMRIKLKNLLSQMYRSKESVLTTILKSQVLGTSCQALLDYLHAMTSFCEFDPGQARSRSALSQRRRSSLKDNKVPTYRNNFNENNSGMEGIILNTLLNPLITKLMNKTNEITLPENIGLYHDVQLFFAYVHEYHGNPLRRSALSAMTARIKSEGEDSGNRSRNDSLSTRLGTEGSISSHNKDNASLRRGLFKRKGDKHQTTINADESEGDSSPSTPRNQPSMDDNLSSIGSPLISQAAKKKSGGKLHFALNLLKSVRNEASEDENWEESTNYEDSVGDDGNSTLTVDARSRISFRNVSSKINSFRQRQSLSIDTGYGNEGILEPNQHKMLTEKTSIAQLYLPSKRNLNILDIREGVRRFSFLLETCRPGQVPDAPLLAALTELRAPVLSRASIILECANFVYRCNKGDWPEWMRSNMSSMPARGGNPLTASSRNVVSGSRKTVILQRAAGRNFYDWGIQLGARLQRFLEKEVDTPKDADEKRRLKTFDDIEDFFDDATVNDASGEHCPPVLVLMACHLLYQITAFLRETFQLLPRSRIPHKGTGSSTGWEKIMSNRRWSILSNTFNQQTGSMHSINELHPERRVSYSTADDDSSPRGSHDLGDEILTTSGSDKKMRRLAQGRQRLLKRGSPSGGPQSSLESSRKKRETSFRRKTKSPADGEDGQNESVTLPSPPQSFMQRRRKAASLRCSAGVRWHMRSMRVRGSPSIHDPGLPPMSPPAGAQSFSELNQFSSTEQSPYQSPSLSKENRRAPLNGKSRDSLRPSHIKQSVTNDDLIDESYPSPERRTGTNSALGSTTAAHHLPHTLEDDEEEMIRNIPWIKVMISVAKKFDIGCTHEKCCSSWCFDRVYRQCNRLTDALYMVYAEKEKDRKCDRRMQLIEGWQNLQNSNVKKRSSNPRRESAIVRQSGMERVPLALRGLLIEKLGEIEETKSSKKDAQASVDNTSVDLSELINKNNLMKHYIDNQLFNIIYSPLWSLLKSAVIMPTEDYKAIINVSWSLLMHADANTVSSAAAIFITSSVKCPDEAIALIRNDLLSNNSTVRSAAINRFHALWRNRFHVWLKLEDGAQFAFKVPPPGIDFTLPSPPIGQSQQAVVDPPWMPHVKTKVEELSLKEEEHSTSQTIMTMTRTRRKQKQEMVKKAVKEAEEKQCELRQQFMLRATPIVQHASYEPALFAHIGVASQAQQNVESDEYEMGMNAAPQSRQQVPVAQPLFPSVILSVVPQLIEMFDDVQVDNSGCSVGELSRKIAWSCIIEDSSLFLRHFLEKLTNREKQEHLFALLRKLILSFRPLPSQTAYTLLNYLFGFVMFYVRTPCEGSDKAMGMALSIIWLLTPYVHGLYFKDMKQTLKKEQCDQAIMITANVPSAKKIIVHGPDSGDGGIPSQFPIHEETQFQTILTDSIEFFNIPEDEVDQYFLVDFKTHQIHLPSSYVRDYYFFHRSFYPQLSLVKLDPEVAHSQMKQNSFQQKLIETGKVLLTHHALKYSPENVVPQRIFFLHDEFTHLPAFPRRSLESCFGFYQGKMGNELQAMDSMHKFVWSQLISDMFEKMENAFMFGDLHLFINVINGILIMHCEDILILRRCMATYLTMAIHFNTLFASQGFFLIMPTIIRCYSQRQTNKLFKNIVEFVCKQFYILHRKPFLLQMFGSIADICDQNNDDLEINAMQVKAKYLFNLLLAMEDMTEMVDELDILPLVPYPKPLKALDLCYRDDPNTFFLLPDAIASCVTVCAFAPESKRSHQMLLIMQAVVPHMLHSLEQESTKQGNSPSALKQEITSYTTICVEMRALINSCEALSRGPTRAFDAAVSGGADRGKSFIADSPQFFDPPTVAEDEPKNNIKDRKNQNATWETIDNSELQKELYRGPREALLLLCAMFIEKAGKRLKELTKLSVNLEHFKIPEMFDSRCHVKISDVALSLLKVAPYDLTTMSSMGIQKYFLVILPVVDWSVETSRSALNIILRRLDKAIAKIAKKASSRKRANWNAIANWLNGLYQTLVAYPYIAHLHPLKTITQMCLRLIAGDNFSEDLIPVPNLSTNTNNTILNPQVPPTNFTQISLKMAAFMMQALGQFAFSLEMICGHEGLGAASERPEAVLCHVLMPLFFAAAAPGKDVPQFQTKDIIFVLNYLHNAINPSIAKQNVPSSTGTTLASTLMRGAVTSHNADASGRQGSISVTDKGHIATVSTHRIIRESVVQTIFLALKVMIVVFNRQLTLHWIKISRIVKDIASKRLGGNTLYQFMEFVSHLNLPISMMATPIIQQKLNQRNISDQEITWHNEFKDRLQKLKKINMEDIKGYSQLLSRLQQELNHMRDDFSSKMIEFPRSHTPTIGDLNSDSGSTQSVSTHKSGRPSESRRLSSSTAFAKLRNAGKSISNAGHQSIASSDAGHNLHDTTILEDIEDETAQMMTGKIQKSPSFPSARNSGRTRSIAGLGVFRSMRRKSTTGREIENVINEEDNKPFRMKDVHHRRTKSWNKRQKSMVDDSVLISPLAMPQSRIHTAGQSIAESFHPKSTGSSGGDRHRVVSFSTQEYNKSSQPSEADSDEYYITAKHHLI
ncbi:unnamed protein product [Bursaphelenchus okinawaensis]|uniref:UNC80 domain-containing protein n=1 Tax=Bursaphelenchus okinawaensis TaxID=465554 RepID=A0A811KJZ2_9BILA|nr:unnamed protein product [Bursaphelenchus okinawaensis]CAG9104799.1 unnamed protein product [Bursaphelenchus okinawaensis]